MSILCCHKCHKIHPPEPWVAIPVRAPGKRYEGFLKGVFLHREDPVCRERRSWRTGTHLFAHSPVIRMA
jgi:hypothetical protein